jgi:hypothetical protein
MTNGEVEDNSAHPWVGGGGGQENPTLREPQGIGISSQILCDGRSYH